MKFSSGTLLTWVWLSFLGTPEVSPHSLASRRRGRLFLPPFVFRPNNFLQRLSSQLIDSASQLTDDINALEDRVEDVEEDNQSFQSSLANLQNDIEDLENSLPDPITTTCEGGRPSDARVFEGRCLQFVATAEDFDTAQTNCEEIQGGILFFLTGEDLDNDDFFDDLRDVFTNVPAAGEFWVDGMIENNGNDIVLGGGLEIQDDDPRFVATPDFSNNRMVVRSNNGNPNNWALEPQPDGDPFPYFCRFPTTLSSG